VAYVSLDEAAQIIDRRTGVDVTVPQLIRLAAMGRFSLCVLLNCRCYSPSARLKKESAEIAKFGRLSISDPSGQADMEAAIVDAYGVFVLPPRHAFDFQNDDEVLVSMVFSLDGKDTFVPSVRRRRDQLQAYLPHLEALVASINEAKGDSDDEEDRIQSTEPAHRMAAQDPSVRASAGEAGEEPRGGNGRDATYEQAPAGSAAVYQSPRRSTPLDGPLALAKQCAADPSSWQSVWAELVRLAESEKPPSPLLGFVEGEGVKYRNLSEQGDGIEFLSREALRARLRRTLRPRR